MLQRTKGTFTFWNTVVWCTQITNFRVGLHPVMLVRGDNGCTVYPMGNGGVKGCLGLWAPSNPRILAWLPNPSHRHTVSVPWHVALDAWLTISDLRLQSWFVQKPFYFAVFPVQKILCWWFLGCQHVWTTASSMFSMHLRRFPQVAAVAPSTPRLVAVGAGCPCGCCLWLTHVGPFACFWREVPSELQ